MFKDLYKQANDKIDTEAAKSRVMARLEKKNAPVRYGSRHIGRYAALAACFLLTFAAASIYESFQREQKNSLPIPVEIAVTTEPEAADSQEEPASDTEIIKNENKAGAPRDTESKSEKFTPAPKAEPKAEAPVTQETDSVKAVAPESTKTEQPQPTAKPDVSPKIEEAAQPYEAVGDETVAVSGGGGRAAIGRLSGSADNFSAAVEGITSHIALPEGFHYSPVSPLTDDIEENTGIEKQSFLFEKGDSYINITITKNIAEIQAENKVIFNEDSSFTAYFISNGTEYEIAGIGISPQELDALLVSLK